MKCLEKKVHKKIDTRKYRKIYKDLDTIRNTNRFVGFMLPGNPRRFPDDFHFFEFFGGLKNGGNFNVCR